MPSEGTPPTKLREALRLACISCLALGLGLLVWGLTPAVILRLVSRDPPPWEALAMGSLTLLIGVTFVGLGTLIQRGIRWAVRAALCGSIFLLCGTLGILLMGGTHEVPLFPTLLVGATTLTSWLAIATEDAVHRTEQSPATPTSTTPGTCPPGNPER
jgi:type IV secretory pathway TrbD component